MFKKFTNIFKPAAILFFASIVLVMVFGGCARRPLTVVNFYDNIDANVGEEILLEWCFKYADSIRIQGSPERFKPCDSMRLITNEPLEINVVAYQGKTDSLVKTSHINIIKPTERQELRRGPVLLSEDGLRPSFNESGFLTGILDAGNLAEPVNLKIMRTIYPYFGAHFLVRASVLDKYGNYLQGYSLLAAQISWSADNKCENINNHEIISSFTEKDFTSSSDIDLGISLDVSAAAEQNNEILNNIKEFVKFLSPSDNVTISLFNQNYKEEIQLKPAENVFLELENFKLPTSYGLNALYKAAFLSVDRLGAGLNSAKAYIAITYNSDNSSIIYAANDIGKIASELDIPVYIIGIGNAIESYSLKYLASLTGGKFYHIGFEEISDLKSILTEIAYAQKGYYEFSVPVSSEQKKCNSMRSVISFETDDTKLNDNAKIILKPTVQYSKYQALATFDYGDTMVLSDYYDVLNSLANVLKDNPSVPIELVGNSSLEGDESQNMELSIKRAEAVKSFLVQLGVSSEQIKTRGIGAEKPIYYLQTDNWQQRYNRRVDLRWLDPTILPFEITAEKTWTENDALAKTEQWEDRGYQVYYDRYINNNTPQYRVKLWGYSTYDEAKRAAKKLESKYKQAFNVE